MAKLKKYLLILLIIAAVIIGVIFALVNDATVALNLIVYTTPPVWVSFVVIFAFGIGLILGIVVTSFTVLKLKVTGRRSSSPGMGQSVASNT